MLFCMLDVSKVSSSVSCRGRDIPLALLFFRPVLQSWRERILPGTSIGEPSLDQVESRIGCLQETSNIEQQLIEENKTSSFIHTDHPSSPSHTYEPKRSQPIQKTHPKHYLRH